MDEESNTKLQVMSEDGKPITIDVIDIFSLEDGGTEYIIYELGGNIYASILYEDEETVELQTITDQSDYAKVVKRIQELVS